MLLEDRVMISRRRAVYYDEIVSIDQQASRLILHCHDGRRCAIKQAAGSEMATVLAAIVTDYPDRLERARCPDSVRTAVTDIAAQPGFVATGFVDFVLRSAARLGASDIHIAPARPVGGADDVEIRMRIDGELFEVGRLSIPRACRVIARLKVLAGLVAHRSDLTQEGRLELEPGEEFRVSCVPALGGERIAIRAYDQIKSLITPDELGYSSAALAELRTALASSQGLVVIAGASASGKTTTAYALLRELSAARADTTSIVSIEDPVECRLGGVDQMEAGRDGSTEMLRSVLRQDVDVLMVGEIRAPDTARAALEASTTGHLVVTTLHAGSAGEAIVRLLELGIEPYVLSTALRAVACQRLVRRADGGRRAIAEVMTIDDDIRDALAGRPAARVLARLGERGGMVPLDRMA